MRSSLLWLAAPAVVLALVLGGCSKGSGTASGDDVVAPDPPPAAQAEVAQPSPGPEFVWIEGFWHWDGRSYGWHAGVWQRPPQTGYVWVAPQYEHVDRGYRYTQGRWGAGRAEARPEARPAERPAARPEERERR